MQTAENLLARGVRSKWRKNSFHGNVRKVDGGRGKRCLIIWPFEAQKVILVGEICFVYLVGIGNNSFTKNSFLFLRYGKRAL